MRENPLFKPQLTSDMISYIPKLSSDPLNENQMEGSALNFLVLTLLHTSAIMCLRYFLYLFTSK